MVDDDWQNLVVGKDGSLVEKPRSKVAKKKKRKLPRYPTIQKDGPMGGMLYYIGKLKGD